MDDELHGVENVINTDDLGHRVQEGTPLSKTHEHDTTVQQVGAGGEKRPSESPRSLVSYTLVASTLIIISTV